MTKLSTLVNYIIIAIISLIMIIMGTATGFLRYKEKHSKYQNNIDLLVKRLQFNLDWPLWNYNYEWMESVIQIELENNYIKAILVYNEDDNLEYGLSKEKKIFSTEEAIIYRTTYKPEFILTHSIMHIDDSNENNEIEISSI